MSFSDLYQDNDSIRSNPSQEVTMQFSMIIKGIINPRKKYIKQMSVHI
jgi:hypothetical protein